jgi:sarcosine oxidase subunit alpha
MPVDVEAPHAAARRTADVVVVGGGPSGMAVASAVATGGRRVEVLDDQLAPGGGLLALAAVDRRPFAEIHASFTDHVAGGRIRMRSGTVAGGMYGTDLLVVGAEGAEVVESQALVFASGAHDGALAFEGNDVPGVMSARAGGVLLGLGVLPGKKIVIVVAEGGGPFGASFARGVPGGRAAVTVVQGEPVAVRGASRAKAVTVRDAKGKETEYPADLVLIDAPRSPAYELAEQAGAPLVHEARGFVVRTEAGRFGAGLYAAGELAGVPFEARALADDAARVAATVLAG